MADGDGSFIEVNKSTEQRWIVDQTFPISSLSNSNSNPAAASCYYNGNGTGRGRRGGGGPGAAGAGTAPRVCAARVRKTNDNFQVILMHML